MLVNPQAYPTFLQYKHLNTIAINRKELFGDVYALVEGDSTQDSTGVPLSDASRYVEGGCCVMKCTCQNVYTQYTHKKHSI